MPSDANVFQYLIKIKNFDVQDIIVLELELFKDNY